MAVEVGAMVTKSDRDKLTRRKVADIISIRNDRPFHCQTATEVIETCPHSTLFCSANNDIKRRVS
jgi:hypothetical protein